MKSTNASQSASPSDVDEKLLGIVKELGKQLNIRNTALNNLTLKTSIDRDLGLDSLSRMELLSRIERAFGVSLPAETVVDASTLADLKNSIVKANTGQKRAFVTKADSLVLEDVANHHQYRETLVDVLNWHVQTHPQRPHIKLCNDLEEGELLTYRDLYRGALSVAAGLIAKGINRGDTVAIMLPTGKEYFYSFMGTLLTGGVPVSLYPPARASQLEDHLLRHSKIVENCEAKMLITFSKARQVARLLKAHVSSLQYIATVDEFSSNQHTELPRVRRTDTAFIQYTSGSTGQPKGVVLTHHNLLSNIRAMGERLAVDGRDVIVSWLPLYHDMGLIGCWLGSLYYSCLFVVMSPLAFLARPERWLWAIHRYQGTISAAPNFAYELCTKRIEPQYIEGLDLSSWRAALNGAEAVSPKTIRKFTEKFKQVSFRPETMMPVYGLAENCVGLTFPPRDRLPLVDRVDREIFARSGKAEPAVGGANSLEFVACGRPLRESEIRIVDELDKEVAERHEGRLQFRSQSATQGYFKNPHQNKQLIRKGWWESGDKAYFAAGDIYITGRIKDIIVHGGRNLYPQELEEAVGDIEHIRKGCVAAFGATDPIRATEKLVVLAETRVCDEPLREKLRSQINMKALDIVGAPPDDVVLVSPHTVLKTSSGKVRRSACRELYEKGTVAFKPRSLVTQIVRLLVTSTVPLARRATRTIHSVCYAIWFWLVVLVFYPVIWLGLMLIPVKSWRWQIMPLTGKVLSAFTNIKIHARGMENLLTEDRPGIFVANHASYLDAFVLLSCIPRCFHFIAKSELSRYWYLRTPLERIDVEFVHRDDHRQSLKDANRLVAIAKAGESLFFFPEGTFTRVAGVNPFHMGAFLTAVSAGVPVIPIAIKGTRSVLHPEAWFPRCGNVELIIGEAIFPSVKPDTLDGESVWRAAVQLRDEASCFILENCGEPDLSQEIPIRPSTASSRSRQRI